MQRSIYLGADLTIVARAREQLAAFRSVRTASRELDDVLDLLGGLAGFSAVGSNQVSFRCSSDFASRPIQLRHNSRRSRTSGPKTNTVNDVVLSARLSFCQDMRATI